MLRNLNKTTSLNANICIFLILLDPYYFNQMSLLLFGGDCIHTVLFTMNHTPTPILGNQSPYEILFHKIPDYTSYKVFGSLCYASILSSRRHNISPRATTAIFLGYLLIIRAINCLIYIFTKYLCLELSGFMNIFSLLKIILFLKNYV